MFTARETARLSLQARTLTCCLRSSQGGTLAWPRSLLAAPPAAVFAFARTAGRLQRVQREVKEYKELNEQERAQSRAPVLVYRHCTPRPALPAVPRSGRF